MPVYDRIVTIKTAGSANRIRWDFGFHESAWYDRKRKVIQGQGLLLDRAIQDDGTGDIHVADVGRGRFTTVDRYAIADDADNPACGWGTRRSKGRIPDTYAFMPRTVGELLCVRGAVAGTPAGFDTSVLAWGSDFEAVGGTLVWKAYGDHRDADVIGQVARWAVTEVRQVNPGIVEFRFDATETPEFERGIPDDQEHNSGAPIFGVIAEYEQVSGQADKDVWARVVASDGTLTELAFEGENEVKQTTERRTFESRYTTDIAPFGKFVCDGVEWDITSVEEIGRRQAVRYDASRVIRRG